MFTAPRRVLDLGKMLNFSSTLAIEYWNRLEANVGPLTVVTDANNMMARPLHILRIQLLICVFFVKQ